MENEIPLKEELDVVNETPNPDYFERESQMTHSDDEVEDIRNS